MYKATMLEAKTRLSELVKRAHKGEEILITSGRDRKPVARIVPVSSDPGKRRIGFLKGRISIGSEFFQPLPEEELRAWEGEVK